VASAGLRSFSSVAAYNAAYPSCPMPTEPAEQHRLRGYHLAMRGLEDDLTGAGGAMIVDFLPGGPPLPGTTDRVGTVVASRWRTGSFVVLAEQVSLWEAWRAIIHRWPTRLSEVRATLDAINTPAR